MKPLRLVVLTLVCSSFGFAVNKDLVAMQRALEDKIDALQQNLNNQIAQLSGMVTAMQNDTRRTADQVAGMQDSLRSAVANSLAPVTGLNNKVESTNEEVRALRDALADLSGRLERMDAKITDLNNKLQIMQNPPPAPGTTNPTGQPGTNGPPVGMSAAQAYTDAFKDKQSGNVDLAYKEFQQYLQYFPNTEYAADAQYYLGEIEYNKRDYKSAIQSFDAVLERYPQNMKTRDARLMKGFALAKDGQRSKAAQELRALIQASPNSEQARRAQQALRDASLFPSASATTRRRPQ